MRAALASKAGLALLAMAVCLDASAAPDLNPLQQRQLPIHVRAGAPSAAASEWTEMRAAGRPLELAAPQSNAEVRWTLDGTSYTLDDYFQRQPVTALLVAHRGRLVVERYQLGANDKALFLSNSMAKSFTGLAVALLHESGKIESLEDATERYLPDLAGTRSGATSVRNHLRMGSGIRYSETYQPGDDHSLFVKAVGAQGSLAALKSLKEQAAEPGTLFNYAGHSSVALSLVVQAVAGVNQARFLEQALWQRLGAEQAAYWREDPAGASLGYCCLLASARDYLRLGVVLANGGQRPDTGEQVIPLPLMRRLTQAAALEPPFRPPRSGAMGYESQFWLSTHVPEAFMLVGIFGQVMAVYPRQRLVILHLAVNTAPVITGTTLARDRPALLNALHRHFMP